MGYRLQDDEALSDAVERIAREQLTHAVEALRGPASKRAEAAHEARKRIKKTRSLLRLVRDAIGHDAYARENGALKEVADVLGPVRAAAALVETLDKLAERYGDEISPKAIGAVRRMLLADRRASVQSLTSDDVKTAIAGLSDVLARVDTWAVDDRFATLKGGLARSVRKGRQGLDAAYHDLDSRAFHELRKAAKDLLYQVQIIRPLWPGMLKRFERELERAADLLGEEHDLAALATWLSAHGDDLAVRHEPATFFGITDQRRLEARAEAQPLAARIYAERPKAFVRRIHGYWTASRGSLGGDVFGIARACEGDGVGDAIVIQ